MRTLVAVLVSVSSVSLAAAATGVDRLFAFWLRGGALTAHRTGLAVGLAIALMALFRLWPQVARPASVSGWLRLLLAGSVAGWRRRRCEHPIIASSA